MFRILKFALIAFGIFCITGCPPPNRIYIITEKGEAWGMQVLDSGYKLDIWMHCPGMVKAEKKQ
jgi:hypothetical protein